MNRSFRSVLCVAGLIAAIPAQCAVYNIVDFGAKGDGTTENTDFIQAAINTANANQLGTVLVPAGTFLSGTIEIKSGVTLRIDKGTTIKGTTNYTTYSPISPGYQSFLTRPDFYPERVFIYAKDAHDVAITGSGTIDGNGKAPPLNFGKGFDTAGRLKSINEIRFIKCTNVRIEGDNPQSMLEVKGSSHWAVQPLNCDGVHIQYVHINNIEVQAKLLTPIKSALP
jgi:polygalacturonase